jgi:hypothetical protein
MSITSQAFALLIRPEPSDALFLPSAMLIDVQAALTGAGLDGII